MEAEGCHSGASLGEAEESLPQLRSLVAVEFLRSRNDNPEESFSAASLATAPARSPRLTLGHYHGQRRDGCGFGPQNQVPERGAPPPGSSEQLHFIPRPSAFRTHSQSDTCRRS